MNYCVPMADGSLHSVTPDEARLIDGFLHERMRHGEEVDQVAVMRMRKHLALAMTPELQFADIYRPDWYQAAWEAN